MGSERDWALGPGEDLGFLGAPSGLCMAFLTQEKPFPDPGEPHFRFQYIPFYPPRPTAPSSLVHVRPILTEPN